MHRQFDNVSIDPRAQMISGPRGRVQVEHRVMRLLVELASQPQHAVDRQTLIEAVWPDVVVSDDSLTKAVSELRKALRAAGHVGTGIVTIPKHGYRLDAVAHEEMSAPARRTARKARVAVLAVGAVFVALLFTGQMTTFEIKTLPGNVPDGALLPVLEYVSSSGDRIKLKGVICDDRPGRTVDSFRQAVEADRLPDGCRLSY